MKALKGGGNKILGLALFVVYLLALSTPAHASVAVNPSSVNFGSVPVGATSSTVQVTLTNNGSWRTNIVSVSVSSSQFSYLGPASFTLGGQSSSSLTVGVAFRPTAAQSYSGSLTFRAGNGSTSTVPLSGTGTSTQTSTITLTINPPSVSLLPGAQQTFIASTHGGNNDGVTWSATCGTFTSDGWYGYYTAPATAGSCSVTGRLTYVPTVSVSAPVTITSAATVAPSITTQPANRTVTAGQTAAFSVSASGTSPFTYQWNKNGAAISGAASSTYTTPATTTSDTGAQFTVVVTNSVGSVTSNAAVLTVNASTLLLTVNPTSLSFGNVNLSASATKSATITNSGTASVSISGVSYSGAGLTVNGLSSGQILPPGQAATLNVTFSPTAAGNVTGSIVVSSNATNSPGTVSISGSGVQLITHSSNLSWIPSTSNVTGYQVYSSTISGGPYARLTSSAVNLFSYTDSTVQSGNTYYYVVTAVDSSSMESAYSNQGSAVIP
jgi:Abnormal spindle-like microcephaly-assoc'd, ASPM-SPD-2-Hydin/Immunoglobulin I-set domain